MSQWSFNPKNRFLGQKVCPVAHPQTDTHTQTDTQSDYWGHPFRVSEFFPSTYHQGSAQYGALSQLPAFTPRLTRRRCCFQHQQHIDNLSQQSLLMLMWDQSWDSSHFLHKKFRLWWCHSYVRDQTPLVNNRLRRVQPLVQGDRQHRDNLSPKSPSCLDASSDSGTPLASTQTTASPASGTRRPKTQR